MKIDICSEEWYYVAINIKWVWEFYLSWLLKYYIINNVIKDDFKIIEQFFIDKWYKKLIKSIWDENIDLNWEDYHSIEYHKNVMFNDYNMYFWDNEFYFDWKDWRDKSLDKEDDLNKYMELDYKWNFTIKQLLFWENFIWELK